MRVMSETPMIFNNRRLMTAAAAISKRKDSRAAAEPVVPASGIPRPTATSIILAALFGYVLADLLCLAVASITLRAGASEQFGLLAPTTFGVHVVLASIAGSLVWPVVRRRARDPYRVLSLLVPVVVLAALGVDAILGVAGALPGTTWTGVAGVMVMHLVTAGCVVVANQYFSPVRRLVRTS
jgi:hypothetical protein